MKYILSIISVVLLIVAMTMFTSDQLLTEVPLEEALTRIVHGQKQAFIFAPYKNAEGQTLNSEERKLLNEGALARRFYENNQKEIKETRCFPITSTEDTIQEKRLSKIINSNPLEAINQISINCANSNMAYVYSRLFPEEAYSLEIDSLDYFRFKDLDNQTLVVSIIEQCGFPFQKETIKAAYEVIITAPKKTLIEYYYQDFEKASNQGLLTAKDLEFLKSRIIGWKFRAEINTAKVQEFFAKHRNEPNFDTDSITSSQINELIAHMNRE